MAYNGSGTFVINTAGQPVVPNTVISATAFNALTADLANGLSTCITKDGQTTPTANIPMGNNKITGLAAGTAGTDAANLSQVQGSTAKLLQSVTGTDTITAAMVPALTSYAAGQMFYFVAAGDNTGAVTINIDSLGAKSVTRDGSTALVAGDITNGKVVVIVYDGTRFQLLNSNAFTNLYVSGNLGVGTASPSYKLDIAFNADAVSAIRVSNSSTGASATATVRLETQGNTWTVNSGRNGGFLSFSDAGGERARFDNAGKFGIGTTNPLFPLVVSAGGAQGLEFSPTALASAPFIQSYNRSSAAFTQLGFDALQYVFRISGAEQMRLDSTGLGIGTASPTTLLDVYRGSYGITAAFRTYDGTNNPRLIIYGTSSGTTIQNTFSSTAVNLMFAVGGAEGAGTEVGRFDGNGNFLVGATTNPGVLNRSVVIDSGASALAGVVLQNNTTGRTSTDGSHIAITGADLKVVNLENAPIIFTTNGVDRAQITGAGSFVAGPSAALSTTATDGFLYVPTCAGTPTGVPTAITGMAPIVVNTTNNKLYFYSGGSWRDAGP